MIHRRILHLASLAALLGIAAVALFLAVNSSNAAPTITTDKPDYHPNDTVVVTGGGFASNTNYDIPVIRPDGSMVTGNGTLTLGWDSVVSSGSGAFTYNYELDGIMGEYEIRVYNYGWNGNLSESPLTSVTFTDAPLVSDFRQCANDETSGPVTGLGNCHWISSIVQSGNASYSEGMSVAQRTLFTNITSTAGDLHSLEFSHQSTKGGIHGYDFLTSWDQAVAAAAAIPSPSQTLTLNPCGQEIGPPGSLAGTCTSLLPAARGGTNAAANCATPSVPDDTYLDGGVAAGLTQQRIDAYETLGSPAFGNRTIRICGNAPLTASFSVADLSGSHTGPDTGDSDINYTLNWTSASTQIYIEKAGHLAVTGTSGVGSVAWGAGQGSSQISGGPYHFKLSMLDGSSLGSQDNQVKGADVVPATGQIIVCKETTPNGDTTSFSFTPSYGAGFSLSDGQCNTSAQLTTPATYSVSETVPAGWSLTSATCSDGSSPASISLDPNEVVTCTFNDTGIASITIQKVCNPAVDPQTFTFTPSYGAPFSLPCGGSNSSGTLTAGTYSVSETAPPSPWSLVAATCSDGSSPASIGLSPGESVTCTFTNSKAGGIVVNKVCNPVADPQTFGFTTSYNGGSFVLGCGGSNSSSALGAGTYSVSETVPPGWNLTTACSDGSAPSSIGLSAGETVVCTFTNVKNGTITIQKVCDPLADAQLFTFTRSYGANLNLGCGGSNGPVSLTPGTYSVSETVPPLWTLTSATCNDGSSPASIGLSAGENVTCTFNNKKDGTIIVKKETDPDGAAGSFTFTGDAAGTISDGGMIMASVTPGTYSSMEADPTPAFDLTSVVCDDSDSSGSVSARTATFVVAAGETVTCTFTNTQRGTIIITKDAVPSPEPVQDFAFTCSGPTAIGGFTLDDDLDGTFSDTATHTNLVPGAYNCSEAGPPGGWNLFSATCSDLSSPSAISLQPGETVTCTFVNQKLGKIIIDKVTTPAADPQTFSFSVAGPTACTPPAIADTSAPAMCGDLAPGSYSVAEIVPAGWALTSASCTDGTPASIPIDPGDVVTCTFNNEKPGTITIQKVCNPPADPQMFTFTRNFGSSPISIGCGGSNGPVSVSPGTYSASETVPPGWTLTSSSPCNDGSPVGAISVAAGENVTCTFTNTKNGKITVNKVCVPAVDPQMFSFTRSYASSVSLPCGGSDGGVSVSPGTYSVSETVPPGWLNTGSSCTAGSPASIPIGLGDTVTCTFTNQKAATIIIVKNTVPDAAQDFSFACGELGVFSLDDDADGTLLSTKQYSDVVPGSYTCTETNVAGYQITISCSDPDNGSSGSAPSATIDADPGETVTCTFTNSFVPGDNPVGGIAGLVEDGNAPPLSPSDARGGPLLALLLAIITGAMLTVSAGWIVWRRSSNP